MLKMVRFRGGHTNTTGSCPGCGDQVARTHAWSSRKAADAYECPRCGTFEYSSKGALLPHTPPRNLLQVLGPVDCIH